MLKTVFIRDHPCFKTASWKPYSSHFCVNKPLTKDIWSQTTSVLRLPFWKPYSSHFVYINHSLIVNKSLTKDISPKTTPVLRLPLGNLAVHICVNKPLTRHLSAESTHVWSLPSCRTYCSYFHVSNPLKNNNLLFTFPCQ